MKRIAEESEFKLDPLALVPSASTTEVALPSELDQESSRALQRMFRDPNVLDEHERRDLIAHLRQTVELAPAVPEVRVLLGMALCVNLEAQEAMEVLREAVAVDPNCFIARLKFGELLMRLRVCDQAAEHTQLAAKLASNAVQSELARRQAATIRTMRREGIERGGFSGMWSRVTGIGRKARRSNAPALVGSK